MPNNDDASIIMQEQRKRNHDEYTIQGVLQDDDTALASPLDALSSSTTTVQLSSACAPLEVAGEEEEGGEVVSKEEKGGKEEEDGGDCRIGSTDAKSISLEVSAEGEEKEEEGDSKEEEEEEDGECRIGTIETASIPLTSAESTAISIKEDVEATVTKEELAAREEEDLSDLPEPEYDYLGFTDLEEDVTNEECSINRQHAMFQEDTVPPSFTECHGLYQNEEGDMDEGDVSSCNNNAAAAAAAARDGDDNDVKVSLTASLSQHEESFARNDKDDYAGTNLEMSPPMTTAAMEQITTHHEHESKQQDTMETYSQLPPSFSQHDDCKPKADHYPPPKDEEEEEEDYSFTSYILGTLVVKVIAARNLKPIERGGLGQLLFGSHHHRNNRRHRSGIGGGGGGSNPYAKIIFDNQSQRTDIMYDTVNPIWPREEQSYFDVVLPIPDLVQEEEEEDGQEIKMKRDKLGYIMEEKSGGYCSRKKGVGKEKRVDNDDGIMASVPLVSDPVLTIVIFHSVGGGNDDSKKKDPNKKANANDDDNDISLGFTSVNIRHLLTGKVTIIDEWFPLSDNGTNSDDDDDDSDDESFHSVISLSDTNNEWPSSSPCLVSSAATATTPADNGGVQTKNQVTKQNNEPRERAKTTNSINFKPHTPPPPPITNEPVVNSTDNPTTYETWNLLTTTNTTTPQTHNPSSLKKHKHKKRPKIHSISYNHTKDCIILSTSQGCRIRTLVPTLTSNASVAEVLVHDVPFPSPDASKTGGTLLSRMLHRTSLLTIVPISTPRTLSLLDARNTPSSSSSILKTLHFTHAIRRIECTKLYLFVLTADGMLHVFHMNESLQRISSISLLHPSESTRKMTESVYTTYAHSFFDISQSVQEECFLVCRHSCDSSSFSTATTEEKEFKGNVISVYSVQDMKLLNCVKAHNHHEVVKMCIGGSKKGEQRLATCSSKVRCFCSCAFFF
mmetsp:Transcript_27089/g.39263  ORF Transcript_27089/g.39263 Transcript_27089/m.39263 type:complete len:956 (-) Transcript_27089:891-3758(-)